MTAAEKVILSAMDYALSQLLEIEEEERENGFQRELYARKCALVEMLSQLMKWPDAAKYGYDWNVEEEFPV